MMNYWEYPLILGNAEKTVLSAALSAVLICFASRD